MEAPAITVTNRRVFSDPLASPLKKVEKGAQLNMLDLGGQENAVFLQIQNSKKPDQMISVVLDEQNAHFETSGLHGLFGVDEIWIDREEFLASMEEYAMVLSFLLETMSAGQDFNLPYAYLDVFEYKGRQYSLMRQNGHRLLKRVE